MRIFGLFASAPPVVSYKVQVATADEDGPVGHWHDLTDALYNNKWNSACVSGSRWYSVPIQQQDATGILMVSLRQIA